MQEQQTSSFYHGRHTPTPRGIRNFLCFFGLMIYAYIANKNTRGQLKKLQQDQKQKVVIMQINLSPDSTEYDFPKLSDDVTIQTSQEKKNLDDYLQQQQQQQQQNEQQLQLQQEVPKPRTKKEHDCPELPDNNNNKNSHIHHHHPLPPFPLDKIQNDIAINGLPWRTVDGFPRYKEHALDMRELDPILLQRRFNELLPNNFTLANYFTNDYTHKKIWDPLHAVRAGKDAELRETCLAYDSILYDMCHDQLPLHDCLLRFWNKSSFAATVATTTAKQHCVELLFPCLVYTPNSSIAKQIPCPDRSMNNLRQGEQQSIDYMLEQIRQTSHLLGTRLFLAYGSGLGSLLYHSRIPADDDVDIGILTEDLTTFIAVLVAATGHHCNPDRRIRFVAHTQKNLMKFFLHGSSFPGDNPWKFPFIDLLEITCNTAKDLCVEYDMHSLDLGKGKGLHAKAVFTSSFKNEIAMTSIFPLVQRPFGRQSLPAPHGMDDAANGKYGEGWWDKSCSDPRWDHRTEDVRTNHREISKCSMMHFPPAHVTTTTIPTRQALLEHGHNNNDYDLSHIQRLPAHPEDEALTVEHFRDGTTRLSSVIYDHGVEVRRSYADGLVGNSDGVISYTLPRVELPNHHAKFFQRIYYRAIPYLPEERQSYLNNRAQRNAIDLNLEVLPMLDRVHEHNNVNSTTNTTTTTTNSNNPIDHETSSLHSHNGNYTQVLKKLQRGGGSSSSGDDKNHNSSMLEKNDIILLDEKYYVIAAKSHKEGDSSSSYKSVDAMSFHANGGNYTQVFEKLQRGGMNRHLLKLYDIVLLQEMDWGMARSGNVHMVRLIADKLSMNYVYGIEFLELTNAYAINNKQNQAVAAAPKEDILSTTRTNSNFNSVGYIGNAILSRWELSNSRIVRLHYNNSQEEYYNGDGTDKSPRRLGGNMVLFTIVHKLDRNVLVIFLNSPCENLNNVDYIAHETAICNALRLHYNNFVGSIVLGGDLCDRSLRKDFATKCLSS